MSLKKALLVISFGTSYDDTMKKNIEVCEKALSRAFPDYDLKRSFTSHIIIRKLMKVQGLAIDTPAMAVERLLLEKYDEVLVQPLHIIPGEEYNVKVLESILPFKNKFRKFSVGKPLIYHIQDYDLVMDALEAQMPSMDKGDVLVLMGHGSDHPANSTYSCLQAKADDRDLPLYIACVEGYPGLDRVISKLKESSPGKIHLMPLMLVAGDHAQNDMAGEDEESWNQILLKEGYDVVCHLQGLGENPIIQQAFVEKAREALEGGSHE
jgi:sirohydrochlorin cobaltochelatase